MKHCKFHRIIMGLPSGKLKKNASENGENYIVDLPIKDCDCPVQFAILAYQRVA